METPQALTPEKSNAVAHALALKFIADKFHFRDSNFRRELGQIAAALNELRRPNDPQITAEDLRDYLLDVLPRLIGRYIGASRVSINIQK